MKRIGAVLLFLLSAAAAAEDRFFDAGGVRLRYVDTGILQDLARDHRVLAFDLRGHGHSDKPHDPRAYDEIALDVIRLLDHLQIDKSHVVGYSLGGIIVAKLLITHQERFLSAVLGGAAYRRSRSERSDRQTDAASGRSDLLAHAALMRARRALLVSDAEIATVRVPSLAVVGAADPALPRVRAMQKVWPGLQVEVVPGAAHPTVHERGLPRGPEFAQAIRQWIAK